MRYGYPVFAIVVLTLLLAPLAASAQGKPDTPGPVVGQATHHDVSPPLRDIVVPAVPPTGLDVEVNPIEPPHRPAGPPGAGQPDAQRQTEDRPFVGVTTTPQPLFSVPGLSDDDNALIVGGRVVPPDTEGDIGPNHYVQWVNLIIAVWNVTRDANGNPTSAVMDAGFGIRPGNAVFAGFGGVCQTTNNGDPIVLYDHLADRWLLSQFAINNGVQCVAVSTGPDPTGSYFRWEFPVSPGEQNDYPKFGLMPDAYYLSLRDFPSNDGTFASAVAFDRAALLAGAANPTFVKFSLPCLNNNCPDGIQPPHLEGPAPPAGTPGIFSRAWDDDFDGPLTGVDGYRLWEFDPDFAVPANSTFTELPIVPSGGNFDDNMCGFFNRNCIPQHSSTQLLDPVDELQMYRAQYRHFAGSHDSLLISTTVDATGTDLAGVRWAELRNTGTGWTLFQDGTYAPEDGLERWLSSAAMDNEGNIAVGYSASSTAFDPSVRYTTRQASDPPGFLPGGEVILQAGGGAQTGANRWGDYSAMSVDPVADCTFWYTQEYYENTNSFDFKTRIGAFQITPCGAPPGTGLQFGTMSIDEVVRTQPLSGFSNPIVVMGPPSFNGNQPTTTRVQNVTASSFEQFIDEWDYLDGPHAVESIGYLALDAGATTLGSLAAEAGSISINHNWTPVSFTQSFASAPVVVAQVASFNGSQAVTTRVRNVTASGFEIRLQEEEANDGTHAFETVHFIAVATGSTTVGSNQVIVARTGTVVTDAFFTVNFGATVANPVFVAEMQTFIGNNPAALRHRNLTTTSVEVKVEEEQSLDAEVTHVAEDVGYILIGN